MTIFKRCPSCGGASLGPDSDKSVRCGDCGFVFYFNPAAAVAALICNPAGELLVTTRGADPGRGLLDLPGGFVDPGESAEAALRREIAEELNLTIASMRYLCSQPNTYVYRQVSYATLDLAFVCRVDDWAPLAAQDDIEDVQFVRPEAIEPDRFAFDSIWRIVSRFIDG